MTNAPPRPPAGGGVQLAVIAARIFGLLCRTVGILAAKPILGLLAIIAMIGFLRGAHNRILAPAPAPIAQIAHAPDGPIAPVASPAPVAVGDRIPSIHIEIAHELAPMIRWSVDQRWRQGSFVIDTDDAEMRTPLVIAIVRSSQRDAATLTVVHNVTLGTTAQFATAGIDVDSSSEAQWATTGKSRSLDDLLAVAGVLHPTAGDCPWGFEDDAGGRSAYPHAALDVLAGETTPAVLLIDRHGIVRYVARGAGAADVPPLARAIQTLLIQQNATGDHA